MLAGPVEWEAVGSSQPAAGTPMEVLKHHGCTRIGMTMPCARTASKRNAFTPGAGDSFFTEDEDAGAA